MQSKLTDLEIRLTHHEVALDEINEVLLQQHGIIESLRNDLNALHRQLQDMTSADMASPEEEGAPPHY